MRTLAGTAAALLLLASCSRAKAPDARVDSAAMAPEPASFHLSSRAFRDGGSIPAQYTCDGANQSPPLSWSGAPQTTKAYALIVDDPDAPGGGFVHWVVYDIPPTGDSLSAAIANGATIANLGEAHQGQNGFGKALGYGGPCPPKGPAHHYHFRLFALDRVVDVNAPASRDDLVNAMQGHEIGHTQLVGIYARR